jgi:hypothetical protein
MNNFQGFGDHWKNPHTNSIRKENDMQLKLIQKGWKPSVWELLAQFVTGCALGSLAGLSTSSALFDIPRHKPSKGEAIPIEIMLLIIGVILAAIGFVLSYQAVREFRRRHVVEDQEFIVEVKSYEIIPEGDSAQTGLKKRKS